MSYRTSFTSAPRDTSMRAEVHMDLYCGDDCEGREPLWFTYGEGDKDASTEREPLQLNAERFPPGTLVTVEEPLCPKCEEPRYPASKGKGWIDKCECGFDWKAWEDEQYG